MQDYNELNTAQDSGEESDEEPRFDLYVFSCVMQTTNNKFMCWPFSGYRGKQLVQAVGDASKPSSIRPPPQGDKNMKSEERKTAGDTASSSKAKSSRPSHQGDNLVNSALEEEGKIADENASKAKGTRPSHQGKDIVKSPVEGKAAGDASKVKRIGPRAPQDENSEGGNLAADTCKGDDKETDKKDDKRAKTSEK